MAIKIITELDVENSHDHVRYFRFDLNAGKTFCYRSIMSYNSFAFSAKNYNHNGKKFVYYCQDEAEFTLSRDSFTKSLGEDIYATAPMIELPDIWSFYDLIGYDHKTKKYR